jgi:hypothetical protein
MEARRPPFFLLLGCREGLLVWGCSRGTVRCRSRWCWCGYAGCQVVGIDDGLGDVRLRLPPEDGGELLLSADIQQKREAMFLGVLDRSSTKLLGNFAVSLLHVGVVGSLGILNVTLESFFLGVDCLEAAGALFVGGGCGECLELLLERFDLGRLSVDRGLFGLELLLNVGDGLLALIGGNDTLLKGNNGYLGGDGLRSDGGGWGGSGSRCCCRSLGEEGGGCEASGQGSSKDKGAVHAVFETPYKDPDSGDFGWVVPGAKRRWEGAAPSSARGTPEGVASLLYLIVVKERVAGARGQSADGYYRRRPWLGQFDCGRCSSGGTTTFFRKAEVRTLEF